MLPSTLPSNQVYHHVTHFHHLNDFLVMISLQTALEAASDYRKQVEENQGEKQQLFLSTQHELNQVICYNPIEI